MKNNCKTTELYAVNPLLIADYYILRKNYQGMVFLLKEQSAAIHDRIAVSIGSL